MKTKSDLRALLLLLTCLLAACASTSYSTDPAELVEVSAKKVTKLGLYLSVEEAYALWQQDPVKYEIIDVRTPEEYIFVGHPTMARNIPVWFSENRYDQEKERQAMHENPSFVAAISERFGKDDTILLTCRSGLRSAKAVDLLADAGFTKAYSVIPGFEGDKVKDEGSPDFGWRKVGGWRLCGLPWTYDLDPELMYIGPE